jgi:hypothetical protein
VSTVIWPCCCEHGIGGADGAALAADQVTAILGNFGAARKKLKGWELKR